MSMFTENYEDRKIAKDIIGDFTVSTISATDIGGYETAIWSNLDEFYDRVHPVERCEREDKVQEMHNRWIEKAKAGIESIIHIGHEDLNQDSYEVNYINNKTIKEKI